MKTLLVGATGLLGPDICQRLMSGGHQVRALVRSTADASKRAALHALGVELVEGDLKDTLLSPALVAGHKRSSRPHPQRCRVRRVIRSKSVDHRGQLALVEAARQAVESIDLCSCHFAKSAIQIPRRWPSAPSKER